MTRTSLALAILTALLGLAAPAGAAAPVALGIGEQKSGMFDDPSFLRLGLREARYIAPWDALADRNQREKLDTWMERADAAGVRVLLGFERSLRSQKLAQTLPGVGRFRRAFTGFRERYPHVRDFIVWNEANHPFSLTGHRPRRAARYFDAVARECPTCRVVAADVLDVGGMANWVRAFLRHARSTPRIWGLHNYVDANRGGSDGTRALLALTSGEVWFTETGGLVLRREYKGSRISREFHYGLRHAAQATRRSLRLACESPRIRRVYLYHWQAPYPVTNWDSAFLGPQGELRPAYDVLLRQVRRARGPLVRCAG